MSEVRKEERLLYAQCQLLKSLRNNGKAKKEVVMKIEEKRQQVMKKQLFFHNYLMANERIRKGEI